jgi:acetolactate synthase-1/3 small subunit
MLRTSAESHKEHFVIIYAQDFQGIFGAILNIFSEKLMTIESLNSTLVEKGIYKIIIEIKEKDDFVKRVVKQIEKQIDILKIENHSEEDLIHSESALYRVPYNDFIDNGTIQNMIEKYQAKIIEIRRDYVFIGKNGSADEISNFFKAMAPYGSVDFNRSGKIIMVRS